MGQPTEAEVQQAEVICTSCSLNTGQMQWLCVDNTPHTGQTAPLAVSGNASNEDTTKAPSTIYTGASPTVEEPEEPVGPGPLETQASPSQLPTPSPLPSPSTSPYPSPWSTTIAATATTTNGSGIDILASNIKSSGASSLVPRWWTSPMVATVALCLIWSQRIS